MTPMSKDPVWFLWWIFHEQSFPLFYSARTFSLLCRRNQALVFFFFFNCWMCYIDVPVDFHIPVCRSHSKGNFVHGCVWPPAPTTCCFLLSTFPVCWEAHVLHSGNVFPTKQLLVSVPLWSCSFLSTCIIVQHWRVVGQLILVLLLSLACALPPHTPHV